MSSIYESLVDPLRPNDAHGISLQLVGRDKSVLELGAASGHVTKALKALGNTVTAVERDGRFLSELTSIADKAHITDLDWLDLCEVVSGRKFDVILAGDVLEHCTRPDLVLHQCHRLLQPGGYVVVSLPNIAHGDVRLALLAGQFDYRPVGLLDHTHLRFFTRKSIGEFADANGFEVAEIHASTAPIGTTEFGAPTAGIPREAIEYVQSDRDHSVYQYVMRLVPIEGFTIVETQRASAQPTEKALAELSLTLEALQTLRANHRESVPQGKVADLQRSFDDSQLIAAALESQLEVLRAELSDAIADRERMDGENKSLQARVLSTRDYAIGTAAELGELRHRLDITTDQLNSVVHQLNLLHSSRTWRIGRFVLLPLRAVRWVMRQLTR